MKVLQPWHFAGELRDFWPSRPNRSSRQAPNDCGRPWALLAMCHRYLGLLLRIGTPLTWLDEPPQPLFQRLELDEILAAEQGLVEEGDEGDAVHGVKGGKKKGGKKMKEDIEGVTLP